MTLNVLKSNQGYIMHEGKVQHIEIIQILRVYNEVEQTHSHSIVCRIGGKATTLNTLPTLYNTEDGCINGNDQVGTENGNRQISNIIGDKYSCSVYYWTANGITSEVVGYLDLRITPSTKNVWKGVNKETGEHEYEEEFDWKVEIINLTDKIYSEENLAKADHSYEVVEADGSTHIHPSFASLATLSEKQQEVFDNLIAAFKACKDAKIGLVIHHWNDCISAYNNDNDIKFCTGWEAPNESSVAIDKVLPDAQYRISASFDACNEDDSIWAN